jgi:putative glutamine amidotransferase
MYFLDYSIYIAGSIIKQNTFYMRHRFLQLYMFMLLVAVPAVIVTGNTGPDALSNKKIIILHPTVANINTWLYLVSNGILPLDPDTEILGLYSEKGAYDYSLTCQYLEREGIKNVSLLGVKGLEPTSLFSFNENSEVFHEVFMMARGIVFFGGPDIPPGIYGQEMNLLTLVTDPHRHYLELSFLYHLLGGYQDEDFNPFLEENPALPVLGICLGMQTMNVAAGGALIQDIPTEVYGVSTVEQILKMDPDNMHRNYNVAWNTDPRVGARSFHRIRVLKSSHMETVSGSASLTPYVLSSHHQALSEIGKGFRVTAISMDEKIVEAIEHTRYPNVIGIQFHPEVTGLYEKENKITFTPGEKATQSFIDLYPGSLGVDFHINFWKHFGEILGN